MPIINEEIDIAKKDLKELSSQKDLSGPEGLEGRKAKQLHKLLCEVEILLLQGGKVEVRYKLKN